MTEWRGKGGGGGSMHSHVDIQKSVGLSVCSSANYRGLVWLQHTRTRTCSSLSTIGLS